ncbi:MAG TPA: LEA type 2 family protein [Bacteroidia bacterium]|jgi:LEA14-like dessication related protein|nr:LEA type 2 family protein [Bacteroidia bacterium]
MIKSLPNILLFFFLALTFSSCKISPVVPTGVQDVKFENFDALKGICDISFGLKINNPNAFNVVVHHVDLDVSIAGVPMGKVAMDDKLKMKKNTEAVYPVKFHAELKDLLTNLPKLLAAIRGKQSDVDLTGSIMVGSGLIRHTFPVNLKQDKVSTTDN